MWCVLSLQNAVSVHQALLLLLLLAQGRRYVYRYMDGTDPLESVPNAFTATFFDINDNGLRTCDLPASVVC